jgi:lycopene cyclase domain-containing protein
MDHGRYLGVLAVCLLVTVPLEFLGGGVYRRPVALARTVVPVLAVFTLWDLVAIARGHWGFSPGYTTGVVLPGAVPVEEVLFFVVIPLCTVLVYEAVGAIVRRVSRAEPPEGAGPP